MEKAPPPRVDACRPPCGPQKIIINSKTSVINRQTSRRARKEWRAKKLSYNSETKDSPTNEKIQRQYSLLLNAVKENQEWKMRFDLFKEVRSWL